MDSTVSVVNLTTQAEISKITVGINPGDIETDGAGGGYVISRGDYSTIPSRMHRIDAVLDQIETTYPFDASEITPFTSNHFLIPYSDFSSGLNYVGLFDWGSGLITNPSFIDGSNLESIYEVSYNTYNDNIYISDAMSFTTSGYVREYSSLGVYLKSYQVGLNPSKIVFYD